MKSLAQISMVALGIVLASLAQSQVLFSFENDLHGFYSGSATLSQATQGASHGSYSMRVEWPGGFDWLFAGSKPGIAAHLNQNRKVLLDITVPQGGNPTPWSNFGVSFNDPIGWRQTYSYGVQSAIPTGGGTRTVLIDCTALTPPAPNSEWFQFNIGVNSGSGPNIIYIDNVRLLNEAQTLLVMSFEDDLHGFYSGSSILSQDSRGATHGIRSMRVEWPGGFDWLFAGYSTNLIAALQSGHVMLMDITVPAGGLPTPWANFAVSFNDPLGWRQTQSYGVQSEIPLREGTFTVAIDLGGLTPPDPNTPWFQLNIAVNAGGGPNVIYVDNIRILRAYEDVVGIASLEAAPSAVIANNTATSTLTFTYQRPNGSPLANRAIRFFSNRGAADTFSSQTAVTDAQGQATVTVRSGTIGIAKITCRDETVGEVLPAECEVTFFDPNSTAPVLEYVKASVHGPFLKRVSLNNTFRARVVTWGAGASPGRIEFRLNNRVFSVPTTTNEASKTFDMGQDLQAGRCLTDNELVVVAINDRGEVSQPKVSILKCIEPAVWMLLANLTTLSHGAIFDNSVKYGVQLCYPSVDIDATAQIPENIPFIGGKTGAEIKKFCASLEVQGDKVTGTVSGGAKLYLAERNGEFNVSASAGFCTCPIKLRELQGGVSGNVSFPFIVIQYPPAAPWIKFEGTFKPEVAIQLGIQEGDGQCNPDSPAGEWHLQPVQGFFRPTVEGTLKLGYDFVASATGTIGVSGGITIQIPGNHQNYCLTPYISQLKGTLFGRISYCVAGFCKEVSKQWDFWNCPPGASGFDPFFYERESGWLLDKRAYLSSPNGYMRRRDFGPEGSSDGEELILQNMYPHAFPSLASRNSEAVVVYSYDRGDPSNPFDLQIGALHYDGNDWQFLPDATDTSYPNVLPSVRYNQAGNPVCVWVGTPTATGTETEPAQFLPKMEIFASQYVNGAWTAPQQITHNSYLDTQPILIQGEDGVLMALWIAQPANQFPVNPTDNINLSCELWAADWNGNTFGTPYLLETGLPIMRTPTAVRLADGSLLLAFSTDHDGRSDTANDHEITLLRWVNGNRSFLRLTHDTYLDEYPRLNTLPSGQVQMVWAKKNIPLEESETGETYDELWSQIVYPTQETAAKFTETGGVTDLQVSKDGSGDPVAIWTTGSEEGNDIYYALYQLGRGSWTAPQQLTRDIALERMLTTGMVNNRLMAVYLKADASLQDVEEEMPDGTRRIVRMLVYSEPDLYAFTHSPFTDLSVSDLRAEGELNPGNTIYLKVDGSCAGDADTTTTVTFYDGDPAQGGTPIGSDTQTLRAGTQSAFSINYTLPSTHTTKTIYAKIDPSGNVQESDEDNNVVSFRIWAPDVAAIGPEVEQYLSDGKVRLLVGIQNLSQVSPQGEIRWQIRRDHPINGPVIAEEVVPIPAAGQVRVATAIWDPGALAPGRYTLHLSVDSENLLTEENEENNYSKAEIALLPDLRFNEVLSRLTVNGASATVETVLQNSGWANAQSILVQVLNGPPGTGTVLASTTVPNLNRAADTSLAFNISLANVSGAIWVVANPNGTIEEVRTDNNSVILLSPITVSGRLIFQDYVGTLPEQVTFEFRQPGQSQPFGTFTVSLHPDGSFVLPAPYGEFDLSVKVGHWLRRTVRVDTTNGSVAGVIFNLINGDVDGNDCIDDNDLLSLLFAFGQTGPNLPADLNGDESVDDVDLLIVLFSFGNGC